MKITITPERDSGLHVENFKASFEDHCEWIKEWLDDEDEEIVIEIELLGETHHTEIRGY